MQTELSLPPTPEEQAVLDQIAAAEAERAAYQKHCAMLSCRGLSTASAYDRRQGIIVYEDNPKAYRDHIKKLVTPGKWVHWFVISDFKYQIHAMSYMLSLLVRWGVLKEKPYYYVPAGLEYDPWESPHTSKQCEYRGFQFAYALTDTPDPEPYERIETS